MIYCINPKCQNPHNPDGQLFCHNCRSELLLDGRYQVIQMWEKRLYTAVYEVMEGGIQKILKVLQQPHNTLDNKLVELFEKEAKVLQELNHPGIPKGYGYFTFKVKDKSELYPCLVMEKIQGENLQKYIKERENRPINEKLAGEWLEKLATILAMVHDKKLFHRDIKPSNIMLRHDGELVLIDFGAVREITDTYAEDCVNEDVTRIHSKGYTAPEQLQGQAVPQSDFFALGRTFVYLLTGVEPKDLPKDPKDRERLIWRDQVQVSEPLADFIDELMAPSPENRPKDPKIILQKLAEIQEKIFSKTTLTTDRDVNEKTIIETYDENQGNSGQILKKILLKTIFAVVGGATILFGTLVMYEHLNVVNGCDKPAQSSFSINDYLSCGEEILIPESAIPEKQQGIEAYAAGNYNLAVDWLKKARQQQPDDPEVLIYLNNAWIEAKKIRYTTIAVAAPISSNPDTAMEILRGVAHAQNERVNNRQNIPSIALKVLIADDANNPTQAKKIAEALTSQSNILAVVGHYTSEITLSTMDIYEKRQLVLMSPGSTSANLPRPSDKFFFRTVPTVRLNAQALASYLIDQASQKKVAIFYNPQSDFSRSFQEQFIASFSGRQGEIVENLNLSNPFFNAGAAINTAQKKGATALVIIPDGGTSRYTFLNAIKLIKANNGRYWMVVANTVSSQNALLVGQDAVNRLVVAVPWITMESPNPDFPKKAQTLWGAGEVSSRTASAYDATQVLIKALETNPNPNRLQVQKALSSHGFEAKGATGVISFLPNGDRAQHLVKLAKVVPSQCSDFGYEFVPEKYEQNEVLKGACLQEK